MTTLTITPDIAKKKLKLAGTVASGEKVAVTIAGFGIVATENLRLRVMAGDIPVGYFPLENEDAWTVSGADLTCTLNLATWQAERHCKFGADVCFILEDTGTPQLYGVGDFSLRPWIKLSGVDVPKNLDNYKVRMDALLAEINRVEGVANGKYTKPETGIPKTDLAPSVRTSLDKADAVTLKVSKSAFDALLGLSLPDSATQKDTRQIVQKILTALQNAATCIALMFALPVFGIDGTTAWEDVPPDRTVKSVVEQFSPPADFSTNNQELVETIQAKAAIPDLTAYLRNDKANNETQTFGGYLSGFGFHADTGYNDNGWNQYTAHNGTLLAQSLPSYIFSNPWGFLKQDEAIPTTGGVFNAYIHLNQKFSVGTCTRYVKPIESVGGSGIAFAFGDNVQTRAANTMVLGVGALNTNNWSFVWNGDANRMYLPTQPNISNPYPSRYNGGFHVNPSVREGMTNPLENFWIGDTNLATWVTTLALGKTGDQTLQSGILTINRDAPDGDAWLQTKRGNQNGLALAFGGFRMDEYFQALPYANGVIALLPDIYAAIEQIAPAFTSKEYALDELCTYNGVVYRCKIAYTAEIYNPKPDKDTTHWEAKNVSELFARLSDLQNYLPLDYFKDGQTIPMYWGDGTKLCDFGANWLGNLENAVSEKPDDDDIPPAISNIVTKAYVENLGITSEEIDPTVPLWAKAPTKPAYTASEVGATSPTAVSNIVTTAYVRKKLGIYLYVGEDGGIYVHTNDE